MIVDIVMLANSKSSSLIQMTQEAIDSIHRSETEHSFNVFLVESNLGYKEGYNNCIFLTPDPPFNYNGYMLYGLQHCNNEWVALANNDLSFHKNWFSNILKASKDLPEVKSFSSFDDSHVNRMPNQPYFVEYGVGTYVTGWCLTAKREIFSIINLDTSVNFWCSDNVYQDELIKHKIPHALIRDSRITHYGGRTLFTMGSDKIHDFTANQAIIYAKRK